MAAYGQHWQAPRSSGRGIGLAFGLLALVAGVAVLAASLSPGWGTALTLAVATLLVLASWRRRGHAEQGAGRWSDLELLEALEDGAPGDGVLTARAHHLPELERFDPQAADRQPWRELEWTDVLQRLRSQSDAWRQARSLQARRRQRLRHLELAIGLLENGVPLAGGLVPDLAALRAEAFLLQADPGQPVLVEVAALQACRMRLAIAAAEPARRPALQAQWARLGTLFALMPTAVSLREQAWRVQRLAWNPRADLDQVDVAYALAGEYRQLLRDWLLAAGGATLADGSTLDEWLLAQCPVLCRNGGDDIAQVEAAQPLWQAFQRLVDELLSLLLGEAEQVERQAALASQRATAHSSVE